MSKKQLRILVAPLDWGLGHVSRTIPIIRSLREMGHEVLFAGDNSQQRFVAGHFPALTFLHLRGYNVRYSRKKSTLLLKIISQIPSILRSIRYERKWLTRAIEEHRIDAVISDNRYGLYHAHIPCVIMTHQLQVLSGSGWPIDALLLRLHYRYLQRFRECWIVDVADEKHNLSGIMGHPSMMPLMRTRYIGLLSQFRPDTNRPLRKDPEVLILLSGAEPQRGIWAAQLWKKALKSDHSIVFVAGSEQAEIPEYIPSHVHFYDRLSGTALTRELDHADYVICRSGYSSIMDLVALGKRAILIPTPGQTEQEYLAKHMQEMGLFPAARQQKFDIDTSIVNAGLFPYATHDFSEAFSIHTRMLEEWLSSVRTSG